MKNEEAVHSLEIELLVRNHQVELQSFKNFEKFKDWKELLWNVSILEAQNSDYKQRMDCFSEVAPILATSKGKDHMMFYVNEYHKNRDIIAKQRARIQEVEAQLDAVDGIMKGEQRQLTQR